MRIYAMVSALTIDAAVLVEGYGRLRLGTGSAFDSIMVSVWSRKIMIVGHAGHRHRGVRKNPQVQVPSGENSVIMIHSTDSTRLAQTTVIENHLGSDDALMMMTVC